MLAAVGAFVWAGTLHNGAIVPFFAISVLSGLVLGADLALPPALLADLIERGATTASGLRSGSYFGIWALATKLTLALAAGIALPLVALLGYVPGTSHTAAGLTALAWCYAGLPCGLKLVAFCLLRRLPTLAHPETNGPTSRPPKRQALG